MKLNYQRSCHDWKNLRSDDLDRVKEFDHMHEVFLPDKHGDEKPRLPFSEYIVEWGYHPMYESALQNPNGIMSQMARKNGKSFRAIYSIPCKGGAMMKVSVVCGATMHCSANAPYEVLMPNIWQDSEDPFGYQTDEDLMILLAKLIAYAKEY
jgi:hypothetical protein